MTLVDYAAASAQEASSEAQKDTARLIAHQSPAHSSSTGPGFVLQLTSTAVPVSDARGVVVWQREALAERAPSWLTRFDEALRRFAKLQANWDSYGSSPPARLALNRARSLLEDIWEYRLKPARIAPTVDQGVMISFLGPYGFSRIECLETGNFLLSQPQPDGSYAYSEAERMDGVLAFLEEVGRGGVPGQAAQDVPWTASG
jgi:hypothetical protein